MSHLPCFPLVAHQENPAPKGHCCSRQKSLLGSLTRGGPCLLCPSSQSFSLQRQRKNFIIRPKKPLFWGTYEHDSPQPRWVAEALLGRGNHTAQCHRATTDTTMAKQKTQPKYLCKRKNKYPARKHGGCCLCPTRATNSSISHSWVPALTSPPLLTKAISTITNEYLKDRSTQSCCWLWESIQHPQAALPEAPAQQRPRHFEPLTQARGTRGPCRLAYSHFAASLHGGNQALQEGLLWTVCRSSFWRLLGEVSSPADVHSHEGQP